VANDVRSKPFIKGDVGQQQATTTFEVDDSVERFATETRLTARATRAVTVRALKYDAGDLLFPF
jgi:hypothetical protein